MHHGNTLNSSWMGFQFEEMSKPRNSQIEEKQFMILYFLVSANPLKRAWHEIWTLVFWYQKKDLEKQCTGSGAGSGFFKDPIKDPDPVGWPKAENKEDPDPIVPHENVSFLGVIFTFKHCFTEDPDPIDVGNSRQGSGPGQPGSDRQYQGSGSGSDRKSTGYGTLPTVLLVAQALYWMKKNLAPRLY